jgi:DNA-binding transcriptional LysR family regulator
VGAVNKLVAMHTFRRVVERGGFSAAAADLELSNAAVSKHVRELEEELGVALMTRTTRRIRLTEAGEDYFRRCCRILDDIEAAELEAGASQIEPRGRLRVSAPMTLGLLHVAPLLSEFAALYPLVQLDLSLDDRFVDLVQEGFDVGLRARRQLEDSSLISRRVCRVERALVAAPSYLAHSGEPQSPAELSAHRLLVYNLAAQRNTWELFEGETRHSVELRPFMQANSGLALRAPLLAGAGIALTPTFVIGDELRTGRVQRIMPRYQPASYDLHVIFPGSRHRAPKVRAFVEFIISRLADPPPWERTSL